MASHSILFNKNYYLKLDSCCRFLTNRHLLMTGLSGVLKLLFTLYYNDFVVELFIICWCMIVARTCNIGQ